MRVLVTGGAGYLGSVLSEHLLAAGHSVTCLDNLSLGQSGPFHLCANDRYDFVRGDARDEALLTRLLPTVDAIIPLACVVGAPACQRDPWMAQTVNQDAIALLNRLRSKQQLVVFPTTNSGYGAKGGSRHCSEETPLEPISLYARTKVDAEAALLQRPGVVTLRLATAFGMSPRMRLDLLVNDFVHRAMTDGYLVVFEKDFRRNFLHVRDVADCVAYCLSNHERMVGRCYNVGLDEANLSKGELAERIKRQLPRLVVHHSEVGSDPDKRDYIVSNQRLREAGFIARRGLDDGITELIKGCRMLSGRPFTNLRGAR